MSENLGERIDASKIYKECGYDIGIKKNHLCPFHPDKEPSLHVYPDGKFYCFGCGKHGDAINFLALKEGIDNKTAYKRACEMLGIPPGTKQIIIATYDYIENSVLANKKIKYIDNNGSKKYYWEKTQAQGGRHPIYNVDALMTAERVYLAEGEKDCDTLSSNGLKAVSCPNGANSIHPELIEKLLPIKEIYICYDNDDAGRNGTDKILCKLKAQGYQGKVFTICWSDNLKSGYDITDFFNEEKSVTDFEQLFKPVDLSQLQNNTDHITETDYKLTNLADIQPETVKWLWEPCIPIGKLTILEGDPGVGKSFITGALATAVSLGRELPNNPDTPQGTVLMLCAEDDIASTIRPRIEKLGADIRKITLLETPIYFDDNGIEMLRRAIEDTKPVLVIIDPIMAYVGKIDIYKANQVRNVFAPLAKLASEYQTAIVCVRHLTKGKQGKAIYRGGGSIDITASARSVLLAGVSVSDKNKRAIIQIKNNLAPLGEPIGYEISDTGFSWQKTTDVTAHDILADENYENTSALDNAKNFLLDILKNGAIPAKEVITSAGETGIAKRTLDRAKKDLGVKSIKQGIIYFWELPRTQDCQNEATLPTSPYTFFGNVRAERLDNA